MSNKVREAQLEAIAHWAGVVVLETPAPKERAFGTMQSYVKHRHLDNLRLALEAAGYDMDAARERMKATERKDKP